MKEYRAANQENFSRTRSENMMKAIRESDAKSDAARNKGSGIGGVLRNLGIAAGHAAMFSSAPLAYMLYHTLPRNDK